MNYFNIVGISEVTEVEKVNHLLNNGWVLINMYTANDKVYYVLGEKRKA